MGLSINSVSPCKIVAMLPEIIKNNLRILPLPITNGKNTLDGDSCK